MSIIDLKKNSKLIQKSEDDFIRTFDISLHKKMRFYDEMYRLAKKFGHFSRENKNKIEAQRTQEKINMIKKIQSVSKYNKKNSKAVR